MGSWKVKRQDSMNIYMARIWFTKREKKKKKIRATTHISEFCALGMPDGPHAAAAADHSGHSLNINSDGSD
jgi:hypothetical protein